jgi:putative DNA primase/helicase
VSAADDPSGASRPRRNGGSDFVPSPELAHELWEATSIIGAAAPSEKLKAFGMAARRAAKLVHPEKFPKIEVEDRLWAVAEAGGLLLNHDVDLLQQSLAEAFAAPIGEDDEQPDLQNPKASVDEADVRPPEFSDEALALLFAERHGHEVKYVAAWDKVLIWKKAVWRFDATLEVYDLARRLCREVASTCQNEKVARLVAGKTTVSAVVTLARVDRRIAATIDQWDSDPWLLNTPAGIIDLRTGKERRHDPKDYCTKITGVAPNDSCATPLWNAFLDRICKGDVEFMNFLQRVVGYALTGVTYEHALFFCYGAGANGKSTFINAITGCIGDYHRVAPIETFTASKNDRHPTELASLRGARLVTSVETEEGRRWAESKIKSLTGGDKIAARFMRQDFFEYSPVFKLLVAGNHRPGLRSVDEAIRRRIHLLPFMADIPPQERDERLGEKLRAEWPGILAWMIRGCVDWQSQALNPPAVVRVATTDYLDAEDALGDWLDKAGHRDPNAFELTQDLFNSWKKYALEFGEVVSSVRKFSQRLEDRGESIGLRKGRDKGSGRRGFYGLRLRAPLIQPESDDTVPL